jgi:hypothetical protein
LSGDSFFLAVRRYFFRLRGCYPLALKSSQIYGFHALAHTVYAVWHIEYMPNGIQFDVPFLRIYGK